MAEPEPIPNTHQIGAFLHCRMCLEEVMDGRAGTTSPKDYARLEVGYTTRGIQVWCVRHDCNVVHIDFQGKSPFPANTRPAVEPRAQGGQEERR